MCVCRRCVDHRLAPLPCSISARWLTDSAQKAVDLVSPSGKYYQAACARGPKCPRAVATRFRFVPWLDGESERIIGCCLRNAWPTLPWRGPFFCLFPRLIVTTPRGARLLEERSSVGNDGACLTNRRFLLFEVRDFFDAGLFARRHLCDPLGLRSRAATLSLNRRDVGRAFTGPGSPRSIRGLCSGPCEMTSHDQWPPAPLRPGSLFGEALASRDGRR